MISLLNRRTNKIGRGHSTSAKLILIYTIVNVFMGMPAYAQTQRSDPMTEFGIPVFGRMVSHFDVELSAQRSGVIILSDTFQKSSFKEGETLFEIDCDVERAQRDIYVATLHQAELELQSRTRLQEYSAATELEVAQSQSAVERAAAELRVYENVLDRCSQTAPFDGIIVERFIQDQEYAREGDPVLHYVNPDQRYFEFLAPASWVDLIHDGTNITVKFVDQNSVAELEVTRVTPVIDAVGQTFKVYANTPETPPDWMRVGIVGQVTLSVDQ